MKNRLKKVYRKIRSAPSWSYGLVAVLMVLAVQSVAWAFAAPSEGDFAYEIYDFMVLRLLNGPVGFCLGIGAFISGCAMAFRNALLQGVIVAGAGMLMMNAESLVTALGAVV